jgi:hypothetical protein
MVIANALLCAAFLILIAASTVVTGSMIVLGLFDLAFSKKMKPPALDAENHPPDRSTGRDTTMRVGGQNQRLGAECRFCRAWPQPGSATQKKSVTSFLTEEIHPADVCLWHEADQPTMEPRRQQLTQSGHRAVA